ncbi:MAG: Ig-like domain-containing protein, partial [Solirubrobacterales bacterium]
MRPAAADAAFNVTEFKMTPSNLQAGGHPNVNYRLNPDAVLADNSNGDDLKKVVLDFPAGALGNPEAATPKCSPSQFNNDACPASSYIGSLSTKLRLRVRFLWWWIYTTIDAPGSVYVLSPPTPGSAITVGFIVRPPGYRWLFMKTEVTGVVGVRSGVDADYGLTLEVDNIPRTLTTTWGSSVSSTVQDITVNLNARANTSQTGPYFTFMPTRCSASPTKATISSYNGVTQVKNDSFTAAGCGSVPFTPTSSYTPSTTAAGQSTGMAATFAVPTADATVQQSHVASVESDMPYGTGLDFPAISSIPATCSEAQLNADSCPAGSKIGVVSADVPFLPPTMTGDVYFLGSNNDLKFGYILRGSNGVKAPLKGRVITIDTDNDNSDDTIRARTTNMPQAPWTSATINFTSELMVNTTECGPQEINTKITGWSGAVVNTTNSYEITDCAIDNEDPVVEITSPADGATVNTAVIPVSYTASDNIGIDSCNIASGSNVTLTPGANAITVTCEDAAGNTGTDTVNVTYVVPDTQAPMIGITSPANGSVTTASSVVVTFNVVDNQDPSPSCSITSGDSVPLSNGSNTITVTCTDASSNTGTASVTVLRDNGPPVVVITSPADGSSTTFSSTTLSYGVTDDFDASPSCVPANGSSQSLSMGPNTLTVTCTDDAGNSGSDSVTVTRNPNPPPVVTITAPTDGAITGASSVVLTFTATDDSGIPPTCDKSSGSSQALAPGANTISVSCTDNQGATTVASVTVHRDAAAPVISITAPIDGSVTQAASTTLNYSVSDNYDASPSCDQADGSTQALSAGANVISVTCTDDVGNSSTASVTVYRDNSAPVVTITSPTNGAVTAASSVTVNYTVADNLDATPSCSIASGSSEPLAPGSNTITVTCTDDAGNSGSDSVTVTRDNAAPVVTITAPGDGTSTTQSSTTVNYTVTDDFDGSPSCDLADGSSVALSLGSNTITVTCTDDAGNAGSDSVTVTRGVNPPPVITITSPVDGLVTSNASVTLNYTATDDSGLPPSCSPPNGSTISLSAGPNTITVNCTDNQGDSSSESVTVTRDNTAPVVDITAPADGTVT